ncbi:DUF523 and DUF1722 domain-containing protein [Deferribacter thermophilus]|uniref:YbgA family protein n=1 Tax=Deferribacter thermophilus TaxID=53573 RepID=UPI003C19E3CE
MKNQFFKPNIILSKCINHEPVRYNGAVITDEFTKKLEDFVNFITVCPEVEIGLSVPRKPLILVKSKDKIKMIELETHKDYSEKMLNFTNNYLKSLTDIDGFLLKAKSPSCGVADTKLYKENSNHLLGKTYGLFAKQVKELFPTVPVEDEGRLKDFWIRQNFLTKIFALAEFRNLKKNITKINDLIKFHQNYKYLLMLYSPFDLKKMGQTIAFWDKHGLEKTISDYEKYFRNALSKKQNINKHINVIQHIYGYFSDLLKPSEKRQFQNLLKKLSKDKSYLKIVMEFLRNYVYRFENPYLATQKYLSPYPVELERD